MTIYYFILYFFVYGFLGWCTEVAYAAAKERRFVNRGFLNGPICPIYGIGVGVVVQFLSPYRSNLLLLYITSVIVVTTLEWLTGFILEKIFHNKWWDYSGMPLNLNGYVCLLFSLIWGVACVAIVDLIHPFIHRVLSFLPHVVGLILIFVLLFVTIADLYVTASSILKMNKRLAKMDSIALELHHISEQIGENIYKSIEESIEKQEELRKKWDGIEVPSEIRSRILELKRLYRDQTNKLPKIHRRLFKAFPKMESNRYKESLRELMKNFRRKN